jgi:hypothetical protein
VKPNRGFDARQMSDHVGVESVFDTTGRPRAGWMHAIFADGPFEQDVGRCVPGPPPADPLVIEPRGEWPAWHYRLLTVFSWSDPGDPIALYAAELPPGNESGWWADRNRLQDND